jgi:hypothetical protein
MIIPENVKILFLKGGKPYGAGLSQQTITDKNGRRVTQWVKNKAGHARQESEHQADLFAGPATVKESLTVAEEKLSPRDAAKYLKDFSYSTGNLEGMTPDVQARLSSPLGKSGRDTLLMQYLGLSREQVHDINNRLDASPAANLRAIDMEDAFKFFPGLRGIIDNAIAEDRSTPYGKRRLPRKRQQSSPMARHSPRNAMLRGRHGMA